MWGTNPNRKLRRAVLEYARAIGKASLYKRRKP